MPVLETCFLLAMALTKATISKLAAIKEEQRSTLGEKYLQMSLYIVANGPDLDQADDVLTRAIYYFFGRKKRRVVVPGTQNKDNLMHAKALAARCKWGINLTEARLTAEVELHKSEDTSGVSARFSTGKASTATRRSRNAEAEKVQQERANDLL